MKKTFSKFLLSVFLLIGGIMLVNPMVSSFAIEGETAGSEIINIKSTKEFITTFSAQTTYENKNIVIKLTEDLNFAEEDMSSIYNDKRTFAGVFDGEGHTISNITLTSNFLYYGLIPFTKDATIKNVRISGDVIYNFDSNNIIDVYAGILTGYAENTTFENCEFDNIKVVENDETAATNVSIDCQVYSDLNFGCLAGKIKGNANRNLPNITNCVSYYDINLNVNKYSNLYVGGLVGQLENAYILNCLNFGNISYNTNPLEIEDINSKNQYMGGIAGYVIGSYSSIINTAFGGDITKQSSLNASVGGIVGGVSQSSKPDVDNINFGYWKGEFNAIGSGLVSNSDKLKRINEGNIDKNFLTDKENFSQSTLTWDFNKIWSFIDAKVILQNFQKFHYEFNDVLDTNRIIDNAYFEIEGSEEKFSSLDIEYGRTIYINVEFKERFQGYYYLYSVLLSTHNVNFDTALQNYAIKDVNNLVVGYRIPIEVSDVTDGSYSFAIQPNTYNCLITISDEAKAQKQGGVRFTSERDNVNEINLPLAYNPNNQTVQRITASGSGLYTFDHWEMYYYEGDNPTKRVDFEYSYNNNLSISFGIAPFNQRFKLVAYFTSENAIQVDFSGIDTKKIKSITLNNDLYQNESLLVPPKASVHLDIVTLKGYALDYNNFMDNFKSKYGVNSISMRSESVKDEENEETTYRFTINSASLENVEDKKLSISLFVIEEKGNGGSNLIWLYILIPIVILGACGVVLFFILRKRNKGGKGGNSKTSTKSKENTEKTSYKDYYI